LEEKSNSGDWAVSFFATVTGTLSILSLNDDLKWTKIERHVEVFVRTYASIVRKMTHWLFGWIHVGWLSVSTVEAHILVLTALLALAIMRAARKCRLRKGEGYIALFIVFPWMIILPGFVLALLLPGDWGALGAGLWLLLIGGGVLHNEAATEISKKGHLQPYQPTRKFGAS